MSGVLDECSCENYRPVFVTTAVEHRGKEATAWANGFPASSIITTPDHGVSGYYQLATVTENYDIIEEAEIVGSCTRTIVHEIVGDKYLTTPPDEPTVTQTSSCADGAVTQFRDSSATFGTKLTATISTALEWANEQDEWQAFLDLGGVIGSGVDTDGEASAQAVILQYRPSATVELSAEEGGEDASTLIFVAGETDGKYPTVPVETFVIPDVTLPGSPSGTRSTLTYSEGGFASEADWTNLPVETDVFALAAVESYTYNYTGIFFYSEAS